MSAFASRPKFSFSYFFIFLLLLLHLNSTNCKTLHLQTPHPACKGTLYPELCVSTLSSIPDIASKSLPQIISSSLNATIKIVQLSMSSCTHLRNTLGTALALQEQIALDDCINLFGDTISNLQIVLSDLLNSPSKHFYKIQTFLSAAITNQYTCLDGFANSDGNMRTRIEKRLYETTHLLSNSLAMLNNIPKPNISKTTTELSLGYGEMLNGFPQWVSRRDRRLLQVPVSVIEYDYLVAKDGSGDFSTISDAVDAAPGSNFYRFIIYIKAGKYFENVEIMSSKTNLMLVGDGIGQTVVTGNRNVIDGWTTFNSATVAVTGDGFIARDITIENTAGPSKHQAVAFRSGSDRSAFYRCSFVGNQDTLYVHSYRQFYRECDVYGTVDFIFGNAAVVLQQCNLYARRPDPNQMNIFTAQGREDPIQNSGISIINCKLAAAPDLLPVQSSFKTYLGRPWKNFSRTVIMKSQLDNLINPAGWLEWNGTFGLSTLYYGEFENTGPGSNTTNRVKWPGYRVINRIEEAEQFTVRSFIHGDSWLHGDYWIPDYDIPYNSSF